MSIYWQLLRIVAKHRKAGYLQSYKDDLLVHDRRELAKAEAGQQMLWALRPCGTALFTVRGGWNPIWLTHWLDDGNWRSVPTKVFLIDVTAPAAASGKVRGINYEQARRLAVLPHPEGIEYGIDFSRMRMTIKYPGQAARAA